MTNLEELKETVLTLLSLIEDKDFTEIVSQLNLNQLQYVEMWASKEILHASDNDVKRLAKPKCLEELI